MGGHIPEPCDGFQRGPPPVFHDVAPDERAGSAEAGLAVDRHRALGVLADLQELLEDLVGGGRPVGEEQLLVVETVALETLGIVDFPANSVRKLILKFIGKSSLDETPRRHSRY